MTTLTCEVCGFEIPVTADAINSHMDGHRHLPSELPQLHVLDFEILADTHVCPAPSLRALLAYWWRKLWNR